MEYLKMTNQARFHFNGSNMALNDKDIKTMRQKLLMDHYQTNEKLKMSRSQLNPQNYRDINPQQRQIQYLQNDNMEKKIKQALSKQYSYNINEKQMKKKFDKYQSQRQQKQAHDRATEMLQQEVDNGRKLNHLYKLEAQRDISYKQQLKQQQKINQQREKQYYRNRYSQDNLGIGKRNSFDQYYRKLNQFRTSIEKNYIEQTIPQIMIRQRQKERLCAYQIANQNRQIFQRQYKDSQRVKQNLRETLLRQIQQKQNIKLNQQQLQKQQHYTSSNYAQRHHPINNPVDFKITHDNRYIFKEMQGKNNGNYISGLARSGSQSLIS